MVYVKVVDIFGEIRNATLSYFMDDENKSNILQMDLFYGNRSNGVFYGSIPSLNNTYWTDVSYMIVLEDDLGYSKTYEGSFQVDGKVTINELRINNQSEVETIEPNKTVSVQADLTTFNTALENVTLYYTTDYDFISEEPVYFTSLTMNHTSEEEISDVVADEDEENSGGLMETYEGKMGPFLEHNKVYYRAVAFDKQGREYEDYEGSVSIALQEDDQYDPTSQNRQERNHLNEIDVITDVEEINIQNLSAKIGFQIDSVDVDKDLSIPRLDVVAEVYKVDENKRITDLNEAINFELTANSSSSGEEGLTQGADSSSDDSSDDSNTECYRWAILCHVFSRWNSLCLSL